MSDQPQVANEDHGAYLKQDGPAIMIVRGEIKEAVALAGTRCEVAEESYADKLKKFKAEGLDATIADFRARQETAKVVGPKLYEISERLAHILHGKLQVDTSGMEAKDKKRHENLCLRQSKPVLSAIHKVAETMDKYSSCPVLEQKGTFIGKIDARTANIGAQEGKDRLAAFKGQDSDATD
jgi:hypothetical protein